MKRDELMAGLNEAASNLHPEICFLDIIVSVFIGRADDDDCFYLRLDVGVLIMETRGGRHPRPGPFI